MNKYAVYALGLQKGIIQRNNNVYIYNGVKYPHKWALIDNIGLGRLKDIEEIILNA